MQPVRRADGRRKSLPSGSRTARTNHCYEQGGLREKAPGVSSLLRRESQEAQGSWNIPRFAVVASFPLFSYLAVVHLSFPRSLPPSNSLVRLLRRKCGGECLLRCVTCG